jgi:UDPglucose 6-dehydrogenase
VNKPVIGVAGMTHLGLVMASAIASKGFSTICYDPNKGRSSALTRGELGLMEPGLDDLLAGNGDRQRFTGEVADLAACDIVYIAQDVPTDAGGQSDLSEVARLIEQVSGALGRNAVAVILCQVPPGFTRALRFVPSSRLYYQVETLIFGRAVAQALEPERFIVGCADPGQALDARLASLLDAFHCPVMRMNFESAEMAKIAINMYLVSSVSLTNLLAEICEKIGADWSAIAPALKIDRRIGMHAYLTPGLGIAGGNLERDLRTLERIAEASDVDAGLVKSWRAINDHRSKWPAEAAQSVVLNHKPNAVLAVWGLAYKENTDSVKNSPSLATIERLSPGSFRIHDPAVSASVVTRARAERIADPLEAARGADALLILTPWPQYRTIAAADIAGALAGSVLIDPYGVVNADAARRAGLKHYTLGRSPGA